MEPVVSSCIPLPQKLYNYYKKAKNTIQEVEDIFSPDLKHL